MDNCKIMCQDQRLGDKFDETSVRNKNDANATSPAEYGRE
jgi:hypothetical protein